jgi:hypothetical protein
VTVSLFNELDIGKELCSGPLFHFLTSLPQRRETILVAAVLIMASKRIML